MAGDPNPYLMPIQAPDPDQQTVIGIAEGRHLVLAPPGCGKTFILAERVIRAHAQGTDYADMACLTFTNRASRGMRERISQRTGNPVPADLFVGNVHRFCSNYLFGTKKIPQNSAVIDDIDAESIIANLARLDPREDHSRFAADIVNLQHALSQRDAGFPQQLIVHNDLLAAADSPEMRHKAAIARQYAEYKSVDNLLDFEDLLEKAYLFAREEQEDPAFHRYRWMQVDEVQDLNDLQFAILDLFAAPDAVVVYLGDEQQAIFSFVGAKVEALERLKQRCLPNLHHLGKNHRSPQYLLELYNTYAARQLGISEELLPHTDNQSLPASNDRCIFRACYHDRAALVHKEEMRCQYDHSTCMDCSRAVADEYRLAVRLARRYGELEREGRVCIIVPTNADADRISREFGETPHFKISGRDLFSQPAMQLLFSHLNVVANETCFIAWARLLHHLHILPDYAAARNLMRNLRSRALSPTDLLLYDSSSYLEQFAHTLDDQEIVLFDTETTGLDVFHDDIIQIAAIKVRHGQLVEGSEFNIILETEKEIPPIVGGHENPMLEVYLNSERLPRESGLRQFMDYCGDTVLFGHNVEYDYHILDHNMQRTLGFGLGQRERFDTLKLIRLVEPRLRVYKLERLLETLHLEGTNSHNAIDDVMATLSLLTYCHRKADEFLPQQRDLRSWPEFRQAAQRFRDCYRDLYLHTYGQLYALPDEGNTTPVLVAELQWLYQLLLHRGTIGPMEKWTHVANFLTADVIGSDGLSDAPTLKEQLDRYLLEINTLRESDLCDSMSMRQLSEERYFIATAHKAKGLEFESVIVFNVTEGSYPYYYNQKSGDCRRIQEDARRLYVALSRAKKHLCLTYSYVGKNGYPAKASPFLQSIAPLLTCYAFNPVTGRLEAVE